MNLYTLKSCPTGWTLTKFTKDLDPIITYDIKVDDGSVTCSCPSRQQPCKHLTRFLPNMAARADSGLFYEDTGPKGLWSNPLDVEFGEALNDLKGPSTPTPSKTVDEQPKTETKPTAFVRRF